MAVGVVVVTYNASEIILDCLESLLASKGVDLRILVVDNASSDQTVEIIHRWALGEIHWSGEHKPFTPVAHGPIGLIDGPPMPGLREIGLVRSAANLGFAGGVNLGLKALLPCPEIDQFWILNPDCMAENETAVRLEEFALSTGRFGVIGGRIYYSSPPLMIQSDGGRINLWTGTCVPFNMTRIGRAVPAPANMALDYISGTHMFVSRTFIDRAGLMPEDYFLYYEEMDWCMRRGDLPLLLCVTAAVHHDGGHSIGSATINQGPSPMSSYFMGRSRMRFVRRYRPAALPITFVYSAAKACRYILRGQYGAGFALLRGIMGMGPSATVQQRIGHSIIPSGRNR